MISLGMIAGVMGAFVGTPSDLIMIRMVADVTLPRSIFIFFILFRIYLWMISRDYTLTR